MVWINYKIRFETPTETLGVGIIESGDYFESVKKHFFGSRISRIFVSGRRRPGEVMKKKGYDSKFNVEFRFPILEARQGATRALEHD